MTAPLTDEEIRQFVLVFARDWKTRTGKNSRHLRIEFAVEAAAHVLSAYESRHLAAMQRERECREKLVEALSRLVRANEEWNADVQQVIGRMPKWTDGYLDDARAALAAAKEME